jgi:hypothetical protein
MENLPLSRMVYIVLICAAFAYVSGSFHHGEVAASTPLVASGAFEAAA